MRNLIKTKDYFKEELKKNSEDIFHYKSLIDKISNQKIPNNREIQNGYLILEDLYQNRINLLYTMKCSNYELYESFNKLLYYYAIIWKPKYSYFDLVKVLSLIILLNVKNKYLFS